MEQIHGVSDENINISDVIEVIQSTDPEFVEYNRDDRNAVAMFSGGGVESVGTGLTSAPGDTRREAYVKILEQPASKALRFRYECEGRSAGSIPGVNSTPENKTYPSIRIENYKGRAVVVVSCVTKDPPYRPHPHNLVGKEACKRGICTVQIAPESMTVTFANLGIQCVKKKDIEEALRVRESLRVDPYNTGFAHKSQPTSIDLNAVRLCFQVFLKDPQTGKFNTQLAPVVSDPIYDKKAMSDLVICKLSDCSCTVAGGKEMILLCEKVAKEDITIRFFEERDGQLIWESLADFQPTHVHKQVAISFRAPRYRTLEVDESVKVFIQLRRPSDGATSEPLPFELRPLDSDPEFKRKRKIANDPSAQMLRHLHAEAEKRRTNQNQNLGYNVNIVKSEQTEGSPLPYPAGFGGGGSPLPLYLVNHGTPSPQPSTSCLLDYRQQPSPGRTPSPLKVMPGPEITQYIPPGHAPPQYNIPIQDRSTLQNSYASQQQHQMMPNRLVNQASVASGFSTLVNSGIANPGPSNVNPTEEVSVMDMDSQQYNFVMGLNQLDSGELTGINLFDTNLSENLSNSLSLSDIQVIQMDNSRSGTEASGSNADNNMTDSLTRMATSNIQDIRSLNNMYKNTGGNIG